MFIRFNPIGMSVFKVEKRISPNQIMVSGCDLISGTPIIDIKPYILCDYVPNYIEPDSINLKKLIPLCQVLINKVEISEDAKKDITNLINNKLLKFYDNTEEVLKLINSILSHNPHFLGKLQNIEMGVF